MTNPGDRPPAARVFFALWPDAAAASRLNSLAGEGARRFGGRKMRAETMHITLAFLGEVPLDRLPAAQAAADRVRVSPFCMRLDRLGFWRHNRIFWAGCSETQRELADLAGQLQSRLRDAGFALEDRPFAPHVTLVRKVVGKPGAEPLSPAIEWTCREFLLVHSVPSAEGSAYQPLARWHVDR